MNKLYYVQIKRLGPYFLKFFLSCLAFWLVYIKIDGPGFLEIAKRLDVSVFVLAFLLYNLSQLLGAIRSWLYLRAIGIDLDHYSNCCLYYLGMFYNLFFPGAIGGDGYKIYFLRKNFSVATLNIVQALLFDRLSGFVALVVLASWSAVGMHFIEVSIMNIFYLTVCSASFIFVCAFIQRWMIETCLMHYGKTLGLSILIQSIQCIVALLIIRSLGEYDYMCAYLVVFLLSSVSVHIPVSLGGLGAREVTVVYLLNFLHMDPSYGLAMAVLFFLIQSLSNCIGIVFYHFNLEPKTV